MKKADEEGHNMNVKELIGAFKETKKEYTWLTDDLARDIAENITDDITKSVE